MCGTSQDPVKGLCNIQIEKTNTILGKWKDFFEIAPKEKSAKFENYLKWLTLRSAVER